MIDVVAAVLVKDDKILIAKRKLEKVQGGYWEFPGGKVEKGEKPSESLIRELNIERVVIMKNTINRIRKFRNDREWSQFHTPANLSKAISIEAGELLEEFLWDDKNYNKEHVLEELADVMVYCIHMADSLNVDLEDIINSKMDKNEKKYPVEKSKGNSKKYTEL